MKKYKPLIVALPKFTMVDTGLRCFLRSYAKHLMTKAELVVPVEVPPDVREAVREAGGTVIRSHLPAVAHLRSADAVSRIARDQPDRPVMVVIPGYTVFQHDHLFRYCDGDAVTVSAESGMVPHDVAAREAWDEFNSSLRSPLRKDTAAQVQIVSPVVAAGPARLVGPFEFARAAMDAYETRTLYTRHEHTHTTALADWAKFWPWFKVVQGNVPWVSHGHWATQDGAVFDKGVAVAKTSGEPYAIFHDWHRVKDVSKQVERIYS